MKTGYEVFTETPVEQQPRVDRPAWALLAGIEKTRGQVSSVVPEIVSHKSVDLLRTRENVYRRMGQDPEKGSSYRLFLLSLQLFRYMPFIKNPALKGEFLELFYLAMRIFDDMVDGDAPHKLPPAERVRLGENILQAVQRQDFSADNPVLAFYVQAQQIGQKLGMDITTRAGEIMRSILFDAKRIAHQEQTGQMKVCSQEELQQHFFDLDIAGTIGLTLPLFDSPDVERDLQLLIPLGQATRTHYNVRDLQADIKAGLCNISREEMKFLHISPRDLEAVKSAVHIQAYPPSVRQWVMSQIQQGRKLLGRHDDQMKNASFPRFTRFVLWQTYQRPAENCFDDTAQTLVSLVP